MSTPGAYHDECGGYHKYSGECSVHWGTMITLGVYHDEFGEYHEYIRVNHEYSGGVQYTGGYHEYIRVNHEYSGGVQYTGRYHEYTRGLP